MKAETIKINCEVCDKKIPKKRKWQRFCSSQCRFKAWAKIHPRTAIGLKLEVM